MVNYFARKLSDVVYYGIRALSNGPRHSRVRGSYAPKPEQDSQ